MKFYELGEVFSSMKALVVYFSRKGENYFAGDIKSLEQGNTQIVAEKIKELANADIFELQTEYEYSKEYYECTIQAKNELRENCRLKILSPLPSIEEYEVIYLGYPNWWGTYPRVVATFLESYDFTGKIVFPFCTHEGSNMGKSLKELKKTLKNVTIGPGLSIRGSEVKKSDKHIEDWVSKTM